VSDVHQVLAHPTQAELVIAAAATGLAISRDGGATWVIDTLGLHAPYCSAVAFVGDELMVAASAHHFALEGAVYRRSINGADALTRVEGGLPRWMDGIVDTSCLDALATTVALADHGGNVYLSVDAGHTWTRCGAVSSAPSGVLVL
jgi:photosystem II stability/assembly factor-like uncharacterized protein